MGSQADRDVRYTYLINQYLLYTTIDEINDEVVRGVMTKRPSVFGAM